MQNGDKDRSPATTQTYSGGSAGRPGGALEKFPVVPPTERQIDLSSQIPVLVKFFVGLSFKRKHYCKNAFFAKASE